jgi:hypothetical protein
MFDDLIGNLEYQHEIQEEELRDLNARLKIAWRNMTETERGEPLGETEEGQGKETGGK